MAGGLKLDGPRGPFQPCGSVKPFPLMPYPHIPLVPPRGRPHHCPRQLQLTSLCMKKFSIRSNQNLWYNLGPSSSWLTLCTFNSVLEEQTKPCVLSPATSLHDEFLRSPSCHRALSSSLTSFTHPSALASHLAVWAHFCVSFWQQSMSMPLLALSPSALPGCHQQAESPKGWWEILQFDCQCSAPRTKLPVWHNAFRTQISSITFPKFCCISVPNLHQCFWSKSKRKKLF